MFTAQHVLCARQARGPLRAKISKFGQLLLGAGIQPHTWVSPALEETQRWRHRMRPLLVGYGAYLSAGSRQD